MNAELSLRRCSALAASSSSTPIYPRRGSRLDRQWWGDGQGPSYIYQSRQQPVLTRAPEDSFRCGYQPWWKARDILGVQDRDEEGEEHNTTQVRGSCRLAVDG